MQISKTCDIEPTSLTGLILGPSGSGKTTLAKTLPNCLVISAESGLLSLRGAEIDYVEVNNLDDVKKALTMIEGYDNIFIDSLTEVGSYILDEATKEYPADNQLLKRFGKNKEVVINFIKYARDLSANVWFTSLVKTDKDQAGRRFNLPDLAGSAAQKLPAYFDFVFSLQVFEKDGEKTRALLTSSIESWDCKDRSGKLDEYEPADLGSIVNKVFNKEEK